MESVTKFDLDDSRGISDYFQSNGYVVVKAAIPSEKIDGFLQAYQNTKTHPLFVYYAQSIHICTRPSLNEFGFVRESPGFLRVN